MKLRGSKNSFWCPAARSHRSAIFVLGYFSYPKFLTPTKSLIFHIFLMILYYMPDIHMWLPTNAEMNIFICDVSMWTLARSTNFLSTFNVHMPPWTFWFVGWGSKQHFRVKEYHLTCYRSCWVNYSLPVTVRCFAPCLSLLLAWVSTPL